MLLNETSRIYHGRLSRDQAPVRGHAQRVPKYHEEKGKLPFRDWRDHLRVAASATKKAFYLRVLNSRARPDNKELQQELDKAKANLYSLIFFCTERPAFATAKRHLAAPSDGDENNSLVGHVHKRRGRAWKGVEGAERG